MTTLIGLAERVQELLGHPDGSAQAVVTQQGAPVLDVAFGTDADTRFPWFSATKPVSATVLHLLVDSNELRYDDPVARFLPEFGADGKGDVTLRHVLTHTGGFPDVDGRVGLDLFADRAALRAAVSALPLVHAPGERVVYHPHSATAVVALVAEAVSGTDFEELVRRQVLEPLGMTTTGWHPDAMTRSVRAFTEEQQQVADSLRAATTTAVIPSGGLYGSARDLAAFYDGLASLLSPGTLHEATRLTAPFSAARSIGFGLHFIVGRDHEMPTSRGTRCSPGTFGHPGWTINVALHDPETGTTVVVLTDTALDQDVSDKRLTSVCDTVLENA